MHTLPGLFISACWLVWLAYWAIAARDVKPTVRRESALSRALNSWPFFLAALLLWSRWPWPRALSAPFLPRQDFVGYGIGAVLLVMGLGFASWARRHLGRNWSGVVTLKQNHTLIRTGPYAIVRHPIYTGLLLGFIGSAIALGEYRGLIAVVLVLFAVLRRMRVEERWMSETFGAAYAEYSATTPALVPFI